jgi:non-specific serine/threonine protein kinase/serine/threonine-protein kinase
VSEDGDPHLLDFGIAKVLDPGLAADPDAEQTQTLLRRLTPISASPEQVAGGSITTASDVYSLGILLYRLLTGVSAYAGAKDFTTEAPRVVREYQPPRPSAAPAVPAKLRRVLAGDLDNIVGKAIEKDQTRRYATVEEFARDLDCYLAGRPVRARPVSWLYRARKFVGRNRLPVSAAALLILAIAGGVAGTLWNARRAERQFEALRKLTNSMLFEFYNSIEKLPGSTGARMLVVRRAQEYLEQMAAEARGNPAVLRDLGAAYERIGQILAGSRNAHLGGPGSFQQARQLFEKALAIRRGLAAANPADRAVQLGILETLQDISKVYQFEGDLPRAIELKRQRLELLERLAARGASDDLKYDLGVSLCVFGALKNDAGDYQSALEYQHRGEAILRTLRDAHPANTRYRWALGIAHLRRGYISGSQHRWAEAANEHRQAVADLGPGAAAGPNDTNVQRAFATANQNLCEMLARANLFSDIRSPCARAVAGFAGLVQADKNNVQAVEDLANADWTMSLALDRMNLPREAIGFEQQARTLYRDVEARDPDSTEAADEDGESLLHLGILEAKLHQPVLARKHLMQALGMYEQLEKRNPRHARILEHLGQVREALQALPAASTHY